MMTIFVGLFNTKVLLVMYVYLIVNVFNDGKISINIDLEDNIRKTENIIENLTGFYDELNVDNPGIRSKYYDFHGWEFKHLPFFNIETQLTYFPILQNFVDWVNDDSPFEKSKLSRLGQCFLLYNDLLEAIEDNADAILASSIYPALVEFRKLPFQNAARHYLKMIMSVYGDEDFMSQSKSARHGIQMYINELSSKHINSFTT